MQTDTQLLIVYQMERNRKRHKGMILVSFWKEFTHFYEILFLLWPSCALSAAAMLHCACPAACDCVHCVHPSALSSCHVHIPWLDEHECGRQV